MSDNGGGSSATSRDYVYDPLSIFFHWVIGLLVIYQIFFPPEIEEVPIDERAPLVTTHTGLGLIILTLIILRILWYWARPAAPAVDSGPDWQNRVAKLVHNAFYVLVFLTPLLGFLSTLSAPYEIAVFDLYMLNPVAEAENWKFELPSFIHKQFSRGMIGLLVVHALAALYHHFIVKDGVLRRMLPFLARRGA